MFLRRLLGPHVDEVIEIAQDYRAACVQQREIIDDLNLQLLQKDLEYQRWGRSIVESFLRVTEDPEMDISDILVDALRDFDDQIARLEEYVA